jgi:hypothetical protein
MSISIPNLTAISESVKYSVFVLAFWQTHNFDELSTPVIRNSELSSHYLDWDIVVVHPQQLLSIDVLESICEHISFSFDRPNSFRML